MCLYFFLQGLDFGIWSLEVNQPHMISMSKKRCVQINLLQNFEELQSLKSLTPERIGPDTRERNLFATCWRLQQSFCAPIYYCPLKMKLKAFNTEPNFKKQGLKWLAIQTSNIGDPL